MRLLLAILALWTVRHAPCRCDLDNDGQASVLDWIVYSGWYFAGDARADWNGSGKVERNDAVAFIAEWQEGCP